MTGPGRVAEDGVQPVVIPAHGLPGLLGLPRRPRGIVLFAHGSGSSRLSPRNAAVAAALRQAGLGTLLFDLLTEAEAADRRNVFRIDLLAERLLAATAWLDERDDTRALPTGYFGASTGAAAALVAATRAPRPIGAVVSRGGRPDLAGPALAQVAAPTLLIVGSLDTAVIALNRAAFAELTGEKEIAIVEGAGHLFAEPGTLEGVIRLARRCFATHLDPPPEGTGGAMFRDRTDAGRQLAAQLQHLRPAQPVVLALPRGGVPVAYEIAQALEAPLDLLLVRKVGAPHHRELAIGAVVDGPRPQRVINREIVESLGLPDTYFEEESRRQLAEIERRRELYRRGRPPLETAGRTVVVVDDGIATGATVRVALRALKEGGAGQVVLAAPVAPADTAAELRTECDEAVFIATPAHFPAVGAYYADFRQVEDDEVVDLLDRAAAATPSP